MESFLGQIAAFPWDWAPRGWSKCDGSLLPIEENQALFSLIGTTYGGDGRLDFALPEMRGRKTRNGPRVNMCINLSGVYPSRS